MRKSLKKAIGSLVTAALTFSALAVVHVTNVFAYELDGTYTFEASTVTPDTMPSWLTSDGNGFVLTESTMTNNNCANVSISDLGITSIKNTKSYYNADGNKSFTISGIKGDTEVKIYWAVDNGSDKGMRTGTEAVNATLQSVDGNTSKTNMVNDIIVPAGRSSNAKDLAPTTLAFVATDSSKVSSYTFTVNGSKFGIYKIIIKYNEALNTPTNTYDWTVDTSALTGELATQISADDFTVTKLDDPTTATIAFKGNDFFETDTAFPTGPLSSEDDIVEGSSTPIGTTGCIAYTYTINLTNSMFKTKTPTTKTFVAADATEITEAKDSSTFSEATTINGFTFNTKVKRRIASGGASIDCVQIPTSGEVTFTAIAGSVITAEFSSTGANNTSTAIIKKPSGDTLVSQSTKGGYATNGRQYISAIAPTNGTYTLTSSSNEIRAYTISVIPETSLSLANYNDSVLNGKVIIDGTTAYVIVAVSERDAAQDTLNAVIGSKKLSFSEGYKQVKANGTVINASDLNANDGNEANLLYGFKITGLTSGAQEELIKHFAIEQ